jgi:hypothetical protein
MKTFREFVFITSSRRYEVILRINPNGWNLMPQNTLLGMGSQGGICLQLRPYFPAAGDDFHLKSLIPAKICHLKSSGSNASLVVLTDDT